jgi:hypothetical protein
MVFYVFILFGLGVLTLLMTGSLGGGIVLASGSGWWRCGSVAVRIEKIAGVGV